ncbi:MAG: BON domain-containing protein [Hydrogenophaga sp.]|jgi:osmotically-inducible protein OsmY|nr:BON domain-containing protein [Hydrogenophaga sp.]
MTASRVNNSRRRAGLGLATLALGLVLPGCAPLLVGGAAVTSAVVITDRRTSGAQLEDQGIELRASGRVRDELGSRVRVNVTSYNRRVLLTGEVPNERDKALVAEIVGKVDNVTEVINELAIVNSPSLRERAADTVITGRIKASIIDVKELPVNAFKIVTERNTVYLMGRVTQREANQATQIARTTQGVQRVVRIMEIITEEELGRLQFPPAENTTTK